jgi:hypothetical protein
LDLEKLGMLRWRVVALKQPPLICRPFVVRTCLRFVTKTFLLFATRTCLLFVGRISLPFKAVALTAVVVAVVVAAQWFLLAVIVLLYLAAVPVALWQPLTIVFLLTSVTQRPRRLMLAGVF